MFTISAAPLSSTTRARGAFASSSSASPSASPSSSRAVARVVAKAHRGAACDARADSAAPTRSSSPLAGSLARADARKCAFGALALGAIAMASFGDDGGVFGAGAAMAADVATTTTTFGLADNANDANELWTLAGGEVPFWANMVKYARFSISIMVGFAYMFGRPVAALMKKPGTAALVLGVGAGGYFFFKFTIETMLGLSDPATMG